MTNKKYCCDRMQGLYSIDKNFGPNFRIIQITDKFKSQSLERGLKIDKGLRYLITQGYSDSISSASTNILFIHYCPFCGKGLSKIYKDKSWINEDNHSW